MNNKQILQIIGLAKRAGKVALGEQALLAIQNREAKLVYIACDAGKNSLKKYINKCEFYGINYIQSFTAEELSMSVGSNYRVVIAILDQGFANKLMSF